MSIRARSSSNQWEFVIWQEFKDSPQNSWARFMLASMVSNLSENVLCLLTMPQKWSRLITLDLEGLAKFKISPMSVIKCRMKKYCFLDLSKPSLKCRRRPKNSISKGPKIGPPNSSKITQIVVILRETDSWLDSQNIHMNFVQILVVQLSKRKLKIPFFGTLLKSN